MNTATAKKPQQHEADLAKMGLKRAKNDRTWDWLREVADNVRNYMQSPAVILPMINDDALVAKVAANSQLDELTGLIFTLGKDAATYGTRFQNLYLKHSQLRGNSTSPDDMWKAIGYSQDYMQFMSSYESVVLPTILDILSIFEKAGLDTSSIRAIANGQLVYSLYNQTPSPDA